MINSNTSRQTGNDDQRYWLDWTEGPADQSINLSIDYLRINQAIGLRLNHAKSKQATNLVQISWLRLRERSEQMAKR